jgi:hypothetical protein
MIRTLKILILVGLMTACQSEGFQEGKDHKSSDGAKAYTEDAIINQKPNQERPSEEVEGVPGYFLDSSKITAQTSSQGEKDRVQMTGAAGAIRSRLDAVIDSKVYAYEVSAESMASYSNDTKLAATLVGETEVEADGSFKLGVTLNKGALLFLTLSSSSPETINPDAEDSSRIDTTTSSLEPQEQASRSQPTEQASPTVRRMTLQANNTACCYYVCQEGEYETSSPFGFITENDHSCIAPGGTLDSGNACSAPVKSCSQ